MKIKNDTADMISSYLESHPFLQEFGQMHMLIQDILKQLPVELADLPFSKECEENFAEGLPLLQNESWQKLLYVPVMQMVQKLAEQLAGAGVPGKLQKFCRELAVYLNENESETLFSSVIRQQDDSLMEQAAALGLHAQTIAYLTWLSMTQILSFYREEMNNWRKDRSWECNYCPVCGSLPSMAQLKKVNHGSDRYLICTSCHTEWKYKRLGCAYCSNEELEKLQILESEEEPQVRLDICTECQSYIKTYVEEGQEAVYLEDWATLHLDMLAAEQGLKKQGLSE